MNRIKRSQEKYEQLFLKEQTVDVHDPEFMAQLQRLIFGEVFDIGSLTDQQREMITCTVLNGFTDFTTIKSSCSSCIECGGDTFRVKRSFLSMCTIYRLSKNFECDWYF